MKRFDMRWLVFLNSYEFRTLHGGTTIFIDPLNGYLYILPIPDGAD